MKLKKHSNKNEYVLAGGYWVRNFTKNIRPIDINKITLRSDYRSLTENEVAVRSMNIPEVGAEDFRYESCVIVSDGYNFNQLKHHLTQLSPKVCVIGVNRSLAKWKDENGLLKRQMNFFVATNPYPECLSHLPKHRYYPPCIISTRVYPEFARKYSGTLYRYVPVYESQFAGETGGYYQIDDYRNPICAAIGLAYRFGVKRLALFCCDDAFKDERPAADKLENQLYLYPQHRIAHSLIEGNLYWLRQSGAIVKDFSHGPRYSDIETCLPENIGEFL